MQKPLVGILGGTFNPVHIGHLRFARAAADALRLARLELMPCAQPPHKETVDVLPFEFRAELLRAALESQPSRADQAELVVSTLEGELPFPSYTWNLIHAWKERHPAEDPLFLLGGEDFVMLESWHKGLSLPEVTNLAVVPRGGVDETVFRQTAARYWPGSVVTSEAGVLSVQVSETTRCLFLPLPFLDISSSRLRAHWLAGGDVHCLTPDPVLDLLQSRKQTVTAIWSQGPGV